MYCQQRSGLRLAPPSTGPPPTARRAPFRPPAAAQPSRPSGLPSPALPPASGTVSVACRYCSLAGRPGRCHRRPCLASPSASASVRSTVLVAGRSADGHHPPPPPRRVRKCNGVNQKGKDKGTRQRVFDIFTREKIWKFWYTQVVLVLNTKLHHIYEETSQVMMMDVVSIILVTGFRALVVSILLCPLAVVFTWGVYTCSAISLWRLIQQDYGDRGGTNLKPALLLLYSLSVFQGVVSSCQGYFALGERHAVETVTKGYKFYTTAEEKIIWDYTESTIAGCDKDPAFAQGRNLITYAVDLIKSEEPDQVVSGVIILANLLALHRHGGRRRLRRDDRVVGQHVLIKQLIGSTSSSGILHKLVHMLHPRCPYNLTIRAHAAMIVAHLAGDIQLERLPRGIYCITSLLDEKYRVMEPYQRDWLLEGFDDRSDSEDVHANYRLVYGEEPYRISVSSYAVLAVQGLQILCKLATDDENRRVMSNTQGLLVSKITAPLCSGELHSSHHLEWSQMAAVMFQLLAVLIGDAPGPGEAACQTLRREIASNTRAISAMESTILMCEKCSASAWLQQRAISMLSALLFHASSASESAQQQQQQLSPRRRFIRVLVDIFANNDSKRSYTCREMAGAQLLELSSADSEGSKATIALILEAANDTAAAKKLTEVLLLDAKDKKRLRTSAAVILKNICSHYSKDDERFEKLKNSIIKDIVPEVLREILCYGNSTGDGKQAAAEPDTKEFSPPDADYEMGNVSQDNARNATSSSQQNAEQQEDGKLQEALLSLCDTVHKKFVSEADPDLARQFDDIAAAVCLEQKRAVRTYTHLVEDAQQLLDAKNKAQELATEPAAAAAET
ncbi:hypothetical protein BS78_07G207200 [Paspalum vaginatum]|nr:hypothetical protein BS78_07G207200 [Paspalum vaginatum]